MMFGVHKSTLVGLLLGLAIPWLKMALVGDRGVSLWRCHGSEERIRSATGTAAMEEAKEKSQDGLQATEEGMTTSTTESIDRKWRRGSRVRLLCWFMTDPDILKKMSNVKDTWSRHCDVRLFMSSKHDSEFPTVGLDVPPGRSHIAAKSRASWAHVYKNYFDQADYFMKADPDSFVVVENLKLFLSERNIDEPAAYGHALYFGHQNWLGNFSGFYTAGQSVVLSREALKRLASEGIDHKYFVDGQAEDLKTIVCLEKRGGYLIDTRDVLGRETFMPAYGLSSMLAGDHPSWYTKHYRKYLGYCTAIDCLSPFPIVFHYVSTEMYLIDYLTSGFNQHQHRRAFVEDSIHDGYLKFNGSMLMRLTVN